MAKDSPSLRPDFRASGGMATLGLEIALSVLFGFLGGRWLDGKFSTEPILALIGLAFGILAASRFLYRAAKRGQKAMEQDGFKESDTGRAPRRNDGGRR